MSNPRRPDAEASRRAILEAAARCFSATGYAGTSMHDIAAAAGVTQSLIHHYYGAKDALWSEVRKNALADYHARIALALGRAGGPTREAMAELFAVLAEHPGLLRMVAWVELQAEGADAGSAAHADALEHITSAQRAGRLSADLPAAHVLTAFTGIVRTWFSDRNLVQDEGDPETLQRVDALYLDAAWAIFCEGAARGPGEPQG